MARLSCFGACIFNWTAIAFVYNLFYHRAELEHTYSKGLQKLAGKLLRASKEMSRKYGLCVGPPRSVGGGENEKKKLGHGKLDVTKNDQPAALTLVYIPTQLHLQRLVSCVRRDVLESGRPQVGFQTHISPLPAFKEYLGSDTLVRLSTSDHWETLFSKRQFWKYGRSWTSITRGKGLYAIDLVLCPRQSSRASLDRPLTPSSSDSLTVPSTGLGNL